MIPIMIEQRIMSLDDFTWLCATQFYSCLDLSRLVCSCQLESNYYTATAQYIYACSLVFVIKWEQDRKCLKIQVIFSVLVTLSQTSILPLPNATVRSLVFFVKRKQDRKCRKIQVIFSVLVTLSQTSILHSHCPIPLFVVLFFSSNGNGTHSCFLHPTGEWRGCFRPLNIAQHYWRHLSEAAEATAQWFQVAKTSQKYFALSEFTIFSKHV